MSGDRQRFKEVRVEACRAAMAALSREHGCTDVEAQSMAAAVQRAVEVGLASSAYHDGAEFADMLHTKEPIVCVNAAHKVVAYSATSGSSACPGSASALLACGGSKSSTLRSWVPSTARTAC